jgi:hypothetical protein
MLFCAELYAVFSIVVQKTAPSLLKKRAEFYAFFSIVEQKTNNKISYLTTIHVELNPIIRGFVTFSRFYLTIVKPIHVTMGELFFNVFSFNNLAYFHQNRPIAMMIVFASFYPYNPACFKHDRSIDVMILFLDFRMNDLAYFNNDRSIEVLRFFSGFPFERSGLFST